MRIPSIVGIAPDAEPRWTMFSARNRIAPGIEPVFPQKDQAIYYAEGRACFRSGEIRILDSSGNVERVIPFTEADRKL
jgi:hypothetical protein